MTHRVLGVSVGMWRGGHGEPRAEKKETFSDFPWPQSVAVHGIGVPDGDPAARRGNADATRAETR